MQNHLHTTAERQDMTSKFTEISIIGAGHAGIEAAAAEINGIGACMLGYNDPDVTAAVVERVQNGSMCTLNYAEEVQLADKLCVSKSCLNHRMRKLMSIAEEKEERKEETKEETEEL